MLPMLPGLHRQLVTSDEPTVNVPVPGGQGTQTLADDAPLKKP